MTIARIKKWAKANGHNFYVDEFGFYTIHLSSKRFAFGCIQAKGKRLYVMCEALMKYEGYVEADDREPWEVTRDSCS